MQTAIKTPERIQLERRAAAVLELKRRKSKQMTVYGIVNSKGETLRCWQDVNGKFKKVKTSPDILIHEKVEPALLIPKPIKLLDGGRGSMKSETVSSIMAARVKDYGHKVGAFREFQATIEDSVHSLISKKIRLLGFDGFDIQDKRILHDNGGAVKYRGLARNPLGIKSMDNFDDFWVEEAEVISSTSIEVLEPTARKKGAEIWYTMNRGSTADPINIEHLKPYEDEYLKTGYYEDDTIMIIRLHYTDNPWFPEVLESKRLKNKKLWSSAKYRHVWDGEDMDEVEGSIIKPEWFDAAVDAHKLERLKKTFEPHGAIIAAHDPSDTGNDSKGFSVRHGSIIKSVKEKLTGEIDEGCDWATGLATMFNADWFIFDGDGMGTGLKRQVNDAFDGTNTKYHMFRGSLSGKGQDNADKIYQPQLGDTDTEPKTYADSFKNNRAQYYTQLAERFYNTFKCVENGEYIDPDMMISIDSDGCDNLPGLKAELCRIPLKDNRNGLIQIMSKQDMKLLKIKSPNKADSIMMTLFSPKAVIKRMKLNQASEAYA